MTIADEGGAERGPGWGPLFALLVAFWFAYPCLTRSQPYTLLDYADLVFHEAGHAVLAAFVSSPFVVSLGGTLGQLMSTRTPTCTTISTIRSAAGGGAAPPGHRICGSAIHDQQGREAWCGDHSTNEKEKRHAVSRVHGLARGCEARARA